MNGLHSLRSLVLGATSCVFVFVAAAHGNVITYDFTGTGGSGPSGNPLGLPVGDLFTDTITVTQDGLSVDITGKDFDMSTGPSKNLDRSAPGGLGVVDGRGFARIGTDEAVEFDFSPALVLGVNSLIFEVGDTSGSFDLYVDGVLAESVGWSSGGGALASHSFATTPTGSVFEFRGGTNSFRVAALSVTVVPEPSSIVAWFVLGGGVMGLIYWRKHTGQRNFRRVRSAPMVCANGLR